jgi:SAM-dependent methyltransferase
MSSTILRSEVHFHDAECGAYRADLPLFERLAAERGEPVLDLGCGTGRAALELVARGPWFVAVHRDRSLVAALAERAAGRGLTELIEAVAADVRGLSLDGRRLPLAIAPMQLLQLLDSAGRQEALRRTRALLEPGGLLCTVLLDEGSGFGSGPAEPLPDVREVDGWVHSSLPLEVNEDRRSIEVVRLRQLVGPDGSLSERRHSVRLERLAPAKLEGEAARAGFRPLGREMIGATGEHVGSVAVLLEAGDG